MRVEVHGRRVVFSKHALERWEQRCGDDLQVWVQDSRLRRKRPRWMPPEPPGLKLDALLIGAHEVEASHYLVGERGGFPLKRCDGYLLAKTFLPKGQADRRLGQRREHARRMAKEGRTRVR